MALELVAFCVDAHDPEAQARLWAALLDGDVVDDPVRAGGTADPTA